MNTFRFTVIGAALCIMLALAGWLVGNEYLFFAGYMVLQYVVLATAWNILAGYCGYVNFGAAAFFAAGAYASIVLTKFGAFNVPLAILVGGLTSGLLGLLMGGMTLRLRGIYFSIATLALSVVLHTIVVNWKFVGGSRGSYVVASNEIVLFGLTMTNVRYLFLLMLALALFAVVVSRTVRRSGIGRGMTAIRDDELAAESVGVPTMKIKLFATSLSGALMGMAGAPLPFYITYLEPNSAFNLSYGLNTIAMAMIGGVGTWWGPVIGAITIGAVQQYATVMLPSAVGLLIVGLLLMAFVIFAPTGIAGLIAKTWRKK